ncbi:MAG: hypothetical protein K0R51_2895 [Cytophagaceae bacterium]|jgi:hypothetical protein|nr:hypothetical protein [Cytophagaceae bacterium]
MKTIKDFGQIELLDKILEIIATREFEKSFFSKNDFVSYLIPENIELQPQEVEPILEKLAQDGFLRKESRLSESVFGKHTYSVYSISWEGNFHHLSGGYKLIFEENTRLKNIEAQQKSQAKQLLILNWLVAAGTIVAAIYSTVEILKTFGVIPPIK